MTYLDYVRPLNEWEPKGKSVKSIFKSLVEHLFATYQMPSFIWSVFFTENPEKFIETVAHIAKGGSLFKAVKSGMFPFPFTQRMCHEFMKNPSDIGFVEAIRRTIVKSYGGSERLYIAWSKHHNRIYNIETEKYYMTVIEWMAKNPMLNADHIGPMLDYIDYKKRQDITFSMKGRSVLAMLKGMEEWHGDLQKAKSSKFMKFRESGFNEGNFNFTKSLQSGQIIPVIYTIKEILTGTALANEGKKMKHCVYSYADRISSGDISIWHMEKMNSFTTEDLLTIEISNRSSTICQVRGKCNRSATAEEMNILNMWASKNNLIIKYFW